MLLRRLVENFREQNWLTLTLELVLVVAGILLAFQLDRAYQNSQERDLEQRYLLRLQEDLRRDSLEIAGNIERTEVRQNQVALLEAILTDPDTAASDPYAFAHALEQVTWRSIATISTGTFDELQTTGRSVLLRSETLRRDLADYYSYIEEQRRLGLDDGDQDRFRLATLGILSGRHLSSIEDPTRYPFEMSNREATRLAEEFASRIAAHAWLGRLVKYQVLMRRFSRDQQARNAGLLGHVDSLMIGSR